MSPFDEAAGRAEFRLTYTTTEPREFFKDMLMGPRIPNAYGKGTSPGDWTDGDHPKDNASAEEWLAHMARMAVNEAVHEALEWFKVDGRQWLDPHGRFEHDIYAAVNGVCQTLAELRACSLDEPDDDPAEDD